MFLSSAWLGLLSRVISANDAIQVIEPSKRRDKRLANYLWSWHSTVSSDCSCNRSRIAHQAAFTFATTPLQSPGVLCRNNWAEGYHGESVRSVSQRQSDA